MPQLRPFQLPQLQHAQIESGGNSALGTLGALAGQAVGTAVAGPAGGAIGGNIGGQLAGTGTVDPAGVAGAALGTGAAQEAIGGALNTGAFNVKEKLGALSPEDAAFVAEDDFDFGTGQFLNKGGMAKGMSPMSMDMPNMLAKGFQYGPLAAVEYKQMGGKVQNHMKVSYHNPLMQKPSAGE